MFLRIPLALFLTIPLLNRLVAGVFLRIHPKICIRGLENGLDWAVGNGRGVE